MKAPPNPLPFDPRPSQAHPKERANRKQMEKENSGFNWLPIGVLALLGVTLAMDVEKDVKKCEKRKEEKEGGSADGGDDDRRGEKGDQRRRHHPQRERREKRDPRRGRSADGGGDRDGNRDRDGGRDRGYGRDASRFGDWESDRRSYDGRRAYGYDSDYEYRRPRRWSGERYR